MNKRITRSFLIGTFLISYLTWGIIIASNQFGYLKFGTPLSMLLFVTGGNAPLIMAYIVLKKAHKISGIRQWAKEAFAIKQSPRHYGLLMAFFALYFTVPALMQGITNGVELYTGLLLIPTILVLGGLEELGWRYILQRELEKSYPFGLAASLTALIWAVWHLPLFFIAGTSQSLMSFGLFVIMVFGKSFAYATIYYLSKSIWLCILFHCLINAMGSSWIIQERIEVKLITSLSMIALALAIYIYHNRRKRASIVKKHNTPA